jgi:hypothetical protein
VSGGKRRRVAAGRGARGEGAAQEGGRGSLLHGGRYQPQGVQDDVIALWSPHVRSLSAHVHPRGPVLSLNVRP